VTVGEALEFDLVVRAGTIHRMTSDQAPSQTVLGITNGSITAIGGAGDFASWSAKANQVIDAPGATITPGLTDNHIHPVLGVDLARGPDLTLLETEAKVRAALSLALSKLGKDDWLLAWGLDLNIAPPGELSNAFLDDLVGDRPAWLRLKDAHSGLASSAALKAAGIPEDSKHLLPQNPGWLVELAAMEPVLAVIPPLSVREKAFNLHEILNMMARGGFTEGFMMDLGDPETFAILTEAESIRPLDLLIRISPWVLPGNLYPTVEDVISLQGKRGERWVVEGAKLMIDGTIDNGTAWLYRPDTKGESTSSIWLDPAQYQAILTKLNDAGVGTSTHAIGDKGVDFVVHAMSELRKTGAKHRVEHVETVTDEVIKLMSDSGIYASMQPTHCTHFVFADGTDNWSVRLGHDRLHEGFRWADIRDAGVPIVFGSDWPVAICDSREIFAAAQLRRPSKNRGAPPILGHSQMVSALDVLRGFTTVADESVSRPPRKIEVGSPATLVMFEQDPLATDPELFSQTKVLFTMIEGQVVHSGL